MQNWTIRDLMFRSSTVMVSGWGVTIIDNCVGSINNVTVGGANAGAPNVNFQYGIWMEGGNGVNLVNGNVFTAESNAEMISGDAYFRDAPHLHRIEPVSDDDFWLPARSRYWRGNGRVLPR